MKQKKEIVSIANYQRLAMRTCLKSCKNRDYADFGYWSEWHELQSKIYGYGAKKIRGDSEEKLAEVEKSIIDEIGDCFWFIALKCVLFKKSFEKIYKSKVADLDEHERQLKGEIDCMKAHCKRWRTLPLACMRKNIAKLSSRKARGVIKGNGDER